MQIVKGFGAIAWFIAAVPSQTITQTITQPASQVISQSASQPTCEFFSAPQRFNTQTSGDIIVIGAQPDRRYRVIITGDNDSALAGIRTCVVDAFVSQSKLGPYIQVGSFNRRSEAESIQRILRAEGYRTRVIYQE